MVESKYKPLEGLPIESIIWLAGLLEGEGCFGLKNDPKGGRRSPRVSLAMCDEDVVMTVGRMFNRKVQTRKPDRPNWSKKYIVDILGKGAVHVMEKVLPYMHSRRAGKIREILDFYYSESEFERRSVAQKAAQKNVRRARGPDGRWISIKMGLGAP